MPRLPRLLAILAIAGTLTALGETPASAMAAGPELPVNTFTTGFQFDPAIAVADDGRFVVAWTSVNQDGSNHGVYFQRFDALGVPQGPEVRANTHTTDSQNAPAVAMDADGDFVIVWQSNNQDGSLWGVYGQRYGADGSPRGSEFRVNAYTTREQVAPAVAMSATGEFVVTWASFGQDGSGYGVFARRFDVAGVPQGTEIRANTFTGGDQNFPSASMDDDGDFVIAWQSFTQGPDIGSNTYVARYDAAGIAKGAVVRTNTYTTSDQGFPSVAIDSDGDFIVVWRSLGQDGSLAGVYGQRYDAAGAPVGSELKVSTYSTQDQTLPAVSSDDGGSAVVTWASDGQDGSTYGVYAQRIDVSGAASGVETLVNTFTTGDQTAPAVGVDADGDFVVAWQSANQDGSSLGVYAQRFLLATPEVCDGLDNDRDGVVDDGVLVTSYVDGDADGHGDPSTASDACTVPAGAVEDGDDADDADATVYPGAPELDDGKDNDQNGTVDDGLDHDRDGHTPIYGNDHDDGDPTVYPNAPELCDGKDNDQDGSVDDGLPDSDRDGAVDCLDPDDDNDGIPDERDPDVVAALITSMPSSALANNGAVSAFTARLDAVESAVGAGKTTQSVKELQAMRQWVDGCNGQPGEMADKNDKVLDCTQQRAVRAALDALIANLSA